MDARGGWLISFAGDLVNGCTLHQSFDEALLAGRRRAIDEARLYFVCEARPGGADPRPLLDAALRGGVDIVQLRDKESDDEHLVSAARTFREAADEHGALFLINDRPDLVGACDADGAHVGQDDMPVAEARGSPARRSRSASPPTRRRNSKPRLTQRAINGPIRSASGPSGRRRRRRGRPAAGLDLIRHAAAAGADAPWFAIGGIDADNIGEVAEAGAQRVVVVRAIRDAGDPEAAARGLRDVLDLRSVASRERKRADRRKRRSARRSAGFIRTRGGRDGRPQRGAQRGRARGARAAGAR